MNANTIKYLAAMTVGAVAGIMMEKNEIIEKVSNYFKKAQKDATEVCERHEELEKARKWNYDTIRLTTAEYEELSTAFRRLAYDILADLSDKMDEDGFVSMATLMQVIWDVEGVEGGLFNDRFPIITKNYDEDTLACYGWTYFDSFCVDNWSTDDFYVLVRDNPHDISDLVTAQEKDK